MNSTWGHGLAFFYFYFFILYLCCPVLTAISAHGLFMIVDRYFCSDIVDLNEGGQKKAWYSLSVVVGIEIYLLAYLSSKQDDL